MRKISTKKRDYVIDTEDGEAYCTLSPALAAFFQLYNFPITIREHEGEFLYTTPHVKELEQVIDAYRANTPVGCLEYWEAIKELRKNLGELKKKWQS